MVVGIPYEIFERMYRGISREFPEGMPDGTCLRVSGEIPGRVPEVIFKEILNNFSEESYKKLHGNPR